MPITPRADKQAIINSIIKDPYVLWLGFNADEIYNAPTTADKIGRGNMQIFVYNAPSRDNASNSLTLGQILQIDVSAPIDSAGTADLCIEQIIALLDGSTLIGHGPLTVIAPSPAPLQCQSGFYCVAARFLYYTSKINQVKSCKKERKI